MTRVVGIDLSLTSTGVVVIENTYVIDTQRIESTGKATATLGERGARLVGIRQRVMRAVTGPAGGLAADLIVIEGPSFGQARQGGQHDRAGLWWDVVHGCHRLGIPIAEVPPSVRMKYATGAGNASKDRVLAAAVRRYPLVDVTGNDVADALLLAAMGSRHLGEPIDDLPQLNLAAMAKVRWPEAAPTRPTPPAPADGTTPPQPIPGQLTIGDDD